MIETRVYLDTTVPSAILDNRASDRRQLTERFWQETLPGLSPVISVVVLAEIRETTDDMKRSEMEKLVTGFEVLPFTEEADSLARAYVNRGVFPEKYLSDATHVAIAVVNGSYLVSWNFRHLVKVRTRREVNLINAIMNYGQIEIIAPPEL